MVLKATGSSDITPIRCLQETNYSIQCRFLFWGIARLALKSRFLDSSDSSVECTEEEAACDCGAKQKKKHLNVPKHGKLSTKLCH